MDKILLKTIKRYIEQSEVTMSSELGSDQTLKQLIADNTMPYVYWEICALLKRQ